MPEVTFTLNLTDNEYQALKDLKELHGLESEDKAFELLSKRTLSKLIFR